MLLKIIYYALNINSPLNDSRYGALCHGFCVKLLLLKPAIVSPGAIRIDKSQGKRNMIVFVILLRRI